MKTAIKEKGARDISSNTNYKRACENIQKWPNWKKVAYNEMFANTGYIDKLEIVENH